MGSSGWCLLLSQIPGVSEWELWRAGSQAAPRREPIPELGLHSALALGAPDERIQNQPVFQVQVKNIGCLQPLLLSSRQVHTHFHDTDGSRKCDDRLES